MPDPTTPGVVVHLNSADQALQESALRNVTNLRAGLGGDTPIEVVVHGPAVRTLTCGSPLEQSIVPLQAAGVRFAACGNSLHSLSLTSDDMQADVIVVPSGVVHLVRRQQDGWAYLRP